MRECMMILRTRKTGTNERPFTGLYIGNRPFSAKDYGGVERNGIITVNGVDVVEFLNLTIKGKTYKERKDSLYNVGVDYSHFDLDGFSYSEFADVGAWFETNGKRYGLYQEFRENAIC